MSELSERKTRTRSPAYPAIGLEEAITLAEKLYVAEDRRFASLEAVAEHWETAQKSSQFLVTIAALKQFGLLQEEGKKEGRKVRLTELALDIVIPGSPKRDEALKLAALNPKIHRELWDKYDGKFPPDVSLRIYLIRERENEAGGVVFNKNYVDGFISQFRSTIAFAKLADHDIIPPAEGGNEKKEENQPATPSWFVPSWTSGGQAMKDKQASASTLTQEKPRVMRDLPVTLPSSLEVAVFHVPVPMTEGDFKTLVNSLTSMKDVLVAPEKK
jgi:hypothetical protein